MNCIVEGINNQKFIVQPSCISNQTGNHESNLIIYLQIKHWKIYEPTVNNKHDIMELLINKMNKNDSSK